MRADADGPRATTLAFDPATRRLTVADRSTIVPVTREHNEAMLRGYLSLVADARGSAVGSITELRQDDVALLVELLDLEDADLEARFVRLLGMTASSAAETRRRLLRHRAMLAAAGISVGLIVGAGGAAAASNARVVATVPAATSSNVSSEVAPVVVSVAAEASSYAPAAAPAPAPAALPDPSTADPPTADPASSTPAPDITPPDGRVEIGDALVIEKGTPPDDPNVQIGDTVVYEK